MNRLSRKLRYILYTLLIAFLAIGCQCQDNTDTDPIQSRTQESLDGIRVHIIDGCEYISYTNYNGTGLTHKGNCKNH